MVGFVNDDRVRPSRNFVQLFLVIPAAQQIGMVENFEARENPADVGKIFSNRLFPDRYAARLRHNQRHQLPIPQDQAFDQHQTNERLPQSDAIAQKRSSMLPRDLHQRFVAILLVAIHDRVNARTVVLSAGPLPLIIGHLMPAIEFLHGFGIHLEGQILFDMPFDDTQQVWSNILGLLPMPFEPGLQLRHISRRFALDVQLHIFSDAGNTEITGTD